MRPFRDVLAIRGFLPPLSQLQLIRSKLPPLAALLTAAPPLLDHQMLKWRTQQAFILATLHCMYVTSVVITTSECIDFRAGQLARKLTQLRIIYSLLLAPPNHCLAPIPYPRPYCTPHLIQVHRRLCTRQMNNSNNRSTKPSHTLLLSNHKWQATFLTLVSLLLSIRIGSLSSAHLSEPLSLAASIPL